MNNHSIAFKPVAQSSTHTAALLRSSATPKRAIAHSKTHAMSSQAKNNKNQRTCSRTSPWRSWRSKTREMMPRSKQWQASAATNGGWEGVRCEKVQAVEGRYTVAIAATAPADSYGAQPAARAAAVVGCAVAHALGASAQRFVEEVGEVGFVSGTIGGVHVAVHQGEVASGLLGAGPVTYDLWGPAVSVARWAVGSHAGPLYGVVVSDAVRTAVGYSSHWRFEEEWPRTACG